MPRILYLPKNNSAIVPDNRTDEQAMEWLKSNRPEIFLPDAPPPEPAKPEPGITSEIGSILKSGAGQGIAGLGKLGQYAGIGGKGLEEYGSGMTKSATEALSPGTQAALQRQFLQAAPEGQGFLGYQLGDAKLTDIPAQFLQSVPVMAGTMAAAVGATALAPASAVAGVGTGVLGFLGRVGLGKVAGRIVTAAGAEAGAAEALAGKLAINTLAGNVAEGLAAAGSSGIETEKAINDFAKLNPDGFFRSPIGQQALQDADGDKNKAIELGAFRAGRSAAALTGISTAILATPGSAFESLAVFGKGAKSGRLHSAIMGGITEGPLQELPQGSAEQYIQNLQRIQAGEPISPGKGVLEAGVQGAIIGTPMGGALGAITGSGKAQELPPLDTQFQRLASKYQENGLNATTAYHTAARDIEKYAQPGETLTVYDSLGRDTEATIVGKNEAGRAIANIHGEEVVLGNEFTVSDPKDGRYGFKKGDEFVAYSELNRDEVTAASDNIKTVINQFNTEFEQTKVKTPEHYSAERQGTSLDAADAILEAKEKKAQEEAVKPEAAKKPVVQAVTPATPASEPAAVVAAPDATQAVAPVAQTDVTPVAPTEAPPDIQASIDAATAAGQRATTEQAATQENVPDYQVFYDRSKRLWTAFRINSAGDQTADASYGPTKQQAIDEMPTAEESSRGYQDSAAKQSLAPGKIDSVVTPAQVARAKGYGQTDVGFTFNGQNLSFYGHNIVLASNKDYRDGISIAVKGQPIGRENERGPEFIDELKIPTEFKDVLRLYAKQKIDETQAKQMIHAAMIKLAIISADFQNSRVSAKQSRAPKKKSTPAAQNTLRQLLTEMREARNKEYYTKALPRVAALIYKRMNQMGLGKYVSNEFLASIKAGKDVESNGEYVERLIKLAIAGKSDKQIMSTLDHEAIHAMRAIGMITDAEWKNLKTLVDKRGWLETFLIDIRYDKTLNPTEKELKTSGLTREAWIKEAKYEEAIADAFATYTNGRSPVLGYDVNNNALYRYKKDLNLAGQPVGIINRILKILGIVKDVVSEDATFKRLVEAPIEADADKLKAETASPKLSVAKADQKFSVAASPETDYVSAISIEPPHNARDTEKLLSLTKSMKNSGWQGRPILTYDVGRGDEALTGSHRIKAAREANIEVPIYRIKNAGDYVDKNGKSIADVGFMELDDQVKWLNKFGDKDAAKLLKQEPEDWTASPKLSVSKADLGREKTGQLYEVYNRKTGKVVGGPYQTRSTARSGADRNDNKYGGYAHDVREVEQKESQKFSVAPRINTDAFKRWFGDSKVVDQNGEPLVVYHGTVDDIKEFDTTRSEMGSHFGDYLAANMVFDSKSDGFKPKAMPTTGRNIIPVYLQINKPLRINDIDSFNITSIGRELKNRGLIPNAQSWTNDIAAQAKVAFGELISSKYPNAKTKGDLEKSGLSLDKQMETQQRMEVVIAQTRIEQMGYDGFIYNNSFEGGGDSYLVFHPEQIKSVFNPNAEGGAKFSVAPRITKNIVQNDDGQFVYTGQIPSTLRSYLENSVFKDKDGNPILMFHGTAQDISEFRAKQAGAIFIAPNPDIAVNYSQESAQWMADHADEIVSPKQIAEALKKAKTLLRENGYNTSQIAKLSQNGILKTDEFREAISVYMPSGPNVMPMFVRAEKPFDYENADQLNEVIKQAKEFGGDFTKDQFSRTNNWTTIEEPTIQRAIKALGYDSFYVAENNSKNLAVYDSSQVKSVTGNTGEFSPESKDIRRSVAPLLDASSLVAISKVANSRAWDTGRNLKIAIQDIVTKAAEQDGIDLSSRDQKTKDYLIKATVQDGLYALQQNKSAIGWYDLKTRQALAIMSIMHPELRRDPNAKLAFIWALAVSSNGQKVLPNFRMANKIYKEYKSTGRMPEDIGIGQAGKAINKGLRRFNQLKAQWGIDKLRKFSLTDFTVGEITSLSKDLTPDGEHAATVVRGSAILGPKVGNGFFSNLYGMFDSLTMDRWLIRTWGRWSGTLLVSKEEQTQTARTRLNNIYETLLQNSSEAKRLSGLIKSPIEEGISIDDLAKKINKASQKPETRAELNATELGSELRLAGNSLTQYLDAQKEAPANADERNFIREVFNTALKEIRLNPNYSSLQMADLQAVLWYAEKRLYETAKKDEVITDENDIKDYNDDEAPDYANAAAIVAEENNVPKAKIQRTLREEENARRTAAARPSSEGQNYVRPQQFGQAIGFVGREKTSFIRTVAVLNARSNRRDTQESSYAYERKSGAADKKPRLLKKLDVRYVAEWNPGKKLKNIYNRNRINTPTFLELDKTEDNAAKFAGKLNLFKYGNKDTGAAVSVYPNADYANMRMFLSEDGRSGFAIKDDGDIVSVFSGNGAGHSIVSAAVEAGGIKLDAFDTVLPEIYSAHGFEVVSRIKWDEKEIPPGWNKKAIDEFNNGEPDVVFMIYNPDYYGEYSKKDGKLFTGDTAYNKASLLQNKELNIKQEETNGRRYSIAGSSLTSDLQKEGAVAGEGIHYSRQERKSLSSEYFGTGYKGAELARVAEAKDPRIKQRIYFYVNGGNGIRPEKYVGGVGHRARLENLYDIESDTLDILNGNSNEDESTILDAGFDGYTSPNAGVAVLLGKRTIPVELVTGQAEVPLIQRSELGPLGQISKAFGKNKSLPGGQMTGAQWNVELLDKAPELVAMIDLNRIQDDKTYYKNDIWRSQRNLSPLITNDEALALQEDGVQNASGKYSHAMRYPDMLKANWPLVPETAFYRDNPDRDDIAIYKGKFIQLPWGDDKKSFGMDHILHNAIRQSNRRWEQVTDKDDENAILGIIDILGAKDLKVFKESPLDNKIIIRSGKFKRAIILGENKDDLRIISVVPSEIPKFGKIIDQTPDVKMSDKVLYQYKNNFTGIKVNFRFETPPATVTVKKTRSYELPKQSIAPKFTVSPYIGATGSLGGSQIPTTFAAPASSKLTDHIYTWADKFVDLKNLQKEIEATIGQLDDQYNAYQKEELYHAKVAGQFKDFMRQEVLPLYNAMKEENVTPEKLNEYVHNRHAEERNDQIDKVNQGVVQGIVGKGSGIATQDARDYLNNLTAQEKASLDRVANMLDGIMQKTRALMVSSGLEEQGTIDAWQKTYKYYVPLERVLGDPDEENTGFTGQGQGYSVSKSVKRAMGSTLDVDHIIANIFATRERTIVRAEKNEIDKAIYALAIKAPNPNIWIAVDPELPRNTRKNLVSFLATFGGFTLNDAKNIAAFPETRSIDRQTGLVTKGRNPQLAKADNVLHLMIAGKEKLVFFNSRNKQANRLVRTLKNLDTANLARGLQTVAAITRYFSAVNTQYNPIFGVVNLIRDVQTGLINIESTPIAGMQKQVAGDFMPAIKGIWSQLRAEAKGGNGTGPWAALFKEFEKYGGPTGYRDMFANSDDRAKMIESEIKALSQGKAKAALSGIGSMLSDYNTAFENGVRLAAYKAARDIRSTLYPKGMSQEQAASLAKNLTVNFNRKGDIALQAGALYAFFNASVQGTARILQTMTRIENGKIVITPLGNKIIRGGLLLGVVQAVALAAAGFDDDNPPQFVREKNIIIPLMNGKYLTVPMPLGFNLLPNLSRNVTEWGMSGFKNTPKRITSLLESVLTGLNPFGGGFSAQTLVPTVIDPVIALYGNTDSFGRKIAREDFSSLRETPGYLRTKDTATPWSKGLSEFLNYASGGTKYMKGALSPTPDQIDYLIGQATGGVGREIGKISQTVSSSVTGEELPSTKIPLVSRFYGDTEESASQSNKYYTNLSRINSYAAEIKGRIGHPGTGTVSEFIQDVPEARLVPLATATYSAIQKIEKLKKQAIERNLPKERIRQFEKLAQDRMKQFNQRVDAFQR